MIYDFKAYFYTEKSGNSPLYQCPLGIHYEDRAGLLESDGFEKISDSQWYLDYRKEKCAIKDVLSYVINGYREEVDAVLNDCKKRNVVFNNITIDAKEIEPFDDFGQIPPLLIIGHDWVMSYEKTDSMCPVRIWGGEKSNPKGETHHYTFPVRNVKRFFKVLTMEEVWHKFAVKEGEDWSADEVENNFSSNVDDALKIASELAYSIIEYGNVPRILRSLKLGLAGENNDERIVGLLYDAFWRERITREELRRQGFSERVLAALEHMCQPDDEDMVDYCIRMASTKDVIAIKMMRHVLVQGKERAAREKNYERERMFHNQLYCYKRVVLEPMNLLSGSY